MGNLLHVYSWSCRLSGKCHNPWPFYLDCHIHSDFPSLEKSAQTFIDYLWRPSRSLILIMSWMRRARRTIFLTRRIQMVKWKRPSALIANMVAVETHLHLNPLHDRGPRGQRQHQWSMTKSPKRESAEATDGIATMMSRMISRITMTTLVRLP